MVCVTKVEDKKKKKMRKWFSRLTFEIFLCIIRAAQEKNNEKH